MFSASTFCKSTIWSNLSRKHAIIFRLGVIFRLGIIFRLGSNSLSSTSVEMCNFELGQKMPLSTWANNYYFQPGRKSHFLHAPGLTIGHQLPRRALPSWCRSFPVRPAQAHPALALSLPLPCHCRRLCRTQDWYQKLAGPCNHNCIVALFCCFFMLVMLFCFGFVGVGLVTTFGRLLQSKKFVYFFLFLHACIVVLLCSPATP